jgi:hypothetical protein
MDITIPDVWQCTVHCDDGRKEVYYFQDRAAVMSSIGNTWSKRPDTIVLVETATMIQVTRKSDGEIELVAIKNPSIRVLSGPTHF